jgi:hypothetical protein
VMSFMTPSSPANCLVAVRRATGAKSTYANTPPYRNRVEAHHHAIHPLRLALVALC